jgi:hypothetical protein
MRVRARSARSAGPYGKGNSVTLSGSAALAACLRDKWRNRLVMSDPDALAGQFCLLRITEAGDDGDASAIISAVRGGCGENFSQPGILHGGDHFGICVRHGRRPAITKDHDAVDVSTDH